MKKLFVLTLTVLMVLSFSTLASAANITLDYGINHQVSSEGSDSDLENTFLLGASIPIENWYIGFDYYSTELKVDNDTTYTNTTIRGGYSFVNDKTTRVTGTLSIINNKLDFDGLMTFKIENAIGIGLDSEFKFDNNMSLNCGFDYAVSGKTVNVSISGLGSGDVDLDSYFGYRLRFNYFFSDTIGASLGYYGNSFKVKGDSDDTTFSGFTLGVNFKF